MMENQLEDKSHFLTTIFQKMSFVSKRQSEHDKKILEQQKQADNFLKTQLYTNYFNMLENGYIPTKSQHKFWSDRIDGTIQSRVVNFERTIDTNGEFPKQIAKAFEGLVNLKNCGVTFQSKHYVDLLFSDLNTHLFKTIQENDQNPGDKVIHGNIELSPNSPHYKFLNEFVEHAKTEEFSNELYKKFTKVLNTAKNSNIDYYSSNPRNTIINQCKTAVQIVKSMPNVLFRNVEMQQYFDLIETCTKAKTHEQYFPRLISALQGVSTTYYAQRINDSLVETGIAFKKLGGHVLREDLPQNTKVILQNIQKQQATLSTLTLSEDDAFLIGKIIDKHIPEVVEKFFSISPDYRFTMKNNDGKNSHDLMNESLNNFYHKIELIIENANKLSLSDLNIKQRYSKSI